MKKMKRKIKAIIEVQEDSEILRCTLYADDNVVEWGDLTSREQAKVLDAMYALDDDFEVSAR